MDLYIKEITKMEEECFEQHVYLKGKSVDTALQDVVGIIEKSLHNMVRRRATMGTPQGEIRSPLVWFIFVNTILRGL